MMRERGYIGGERLHPTTHIAIPFFPTCPLLLPLLLPSLLNLPPLPSPLRALMLQLEMRWEEK